MKNPPPLTVSSIITVLLLTLHVTTAMMPASQKTNPTSPNQRPHIVVIMADDFGWNDVGYRNPERYTPNIDRMAAEGVEFKYSYMNQVCTPSRAAFMTGIYPFRMGLQNSVLFALQNDSLPLGYATLPERLQSLGYKTHMVGKWHLGFCNYDMTPTRRGFDTFYGMYTGHSTYFSHLSKWNGYDLQDNVGPDPRNFRTAWEGDGKYSTTLFTDRAVEIVHNHDKSRPLYLFLSYQAVHKPLEVPEEYLRFCPDIGDEKRRQHCAMAAAMDEGIGRLVEALDEQGMRDNLITLFVSDNGGAVPAGSSNWPLRGSKITLWEGGTRVVTILHSKTLLPKAPYEWNGLFHAVDWYPTLVRAAGDNRGVSGIDGVDSWVKITRNYANSSRSSFVYNIDDVRNTSALRYNQYKLINNKPGSMNGWYNPPAGGQDQKPPSESYPEYMLFNLATDPTEKDDLLSKPRVSQEALGVSRTMIPMLNDFKKGLKPTVEAEKVKDGRPALHGGAWVSGWC